MIRNPIGLKEVQAVYNGPEGRLWELIMGEQIHIGGYAESLVLAQKAQIRNGYKVVDLCCALGAGVRFLVKNFNIIGTGVDGTERMIEEAQKRAAAENLNEKIDFLLCDVTQTPLPSETYDVVWGEDAWCYVVDKDALIGEAVRLLKKGGVLAFSDWIEGNNTLSDEEATRINSFMKFPSMESISGYEALIQKHGLRLISSEDLNLHFAESIELYIHLMTKQLTFDALKIIGDDKKTFDAVVGEMRYMLDLAQKGKFSRGRWIAMKNR
ncbi:MAG: methyltransferase domain-containing protein [Chitinivibrionales bacterium]|nr:methyltransferase domain-containing protein [Chitinivibrionales bacterium]